MAVIVYSGIPGSGKSYEVVRSVVIPAVKAGRRVVTNIDGMDGELIRQYCVTKFGSSLESLGSVVKVSQTQVSAPAFFPLVVDNAIVPGDYLVNPGDIVCIDEGYKYWGSGEKIHSSHMVFFREHRHFAHPESGLTCDLVIMTQSLSDLHRMLVRIVEQNYVTHKAKALKDNLYTITQYEGNKQTKRAIVRDWTGTYDPEIFPLYKSYFGGKGKEGVVDSRQKFFTRKVFFKLGFFIFAAGFIVYKFGHFLYQKVYVDPMASGKPAPSAAAPVHRASYPPGFPVPPAGASGDAMAAPVSGEWRIVGAMVVGGRRSVVLSSSSGRVRVVPGDAFVGEGASEFGVVDGQRVTRFSGQVASGAGVKP